MSGGWFPPAAVPLLFFSLYVVIVVDARCRNTRGQTPHEIYCDKFYNCWDGEESVTQCPRGLLFNEHPARPFCDYPKNVHCASRRLSRPLTPYKSICPQPFGTFPSPYNCSEFYNCVGGLAYKQGCPLYTVYNQDSGVCDHDYLAPCFGVILGIHPEDTIDYVLPASILSSGTLTRPERPPSRPSRPGRPGGSQGGSSSSSSSNRPGSTNTIDGGSTNDNSDEQHDSDQSFPVDDYKPPQAAVYPALPGSPALLNFICPVRNGYFPVSGDCSLVMVCLDYEKMLLTCPPGMLFDRRRSKCDFTRYVQCF